MLYYPQHPRADSRGRVFEHIVVWENYHHCKVNPGYIIHHINGKKDADFFFINPGKYYVRLFFDRNGNGSWDTGLYEDHRQAEEVYYYPQALDLKAQWDVEQDWSLRATPVNRQKPLEITKQKPDEKKSVKGRNAERERKKRQ